VKGDIPDVPQYGNKMSLSTYRKRFIDFDSKSRSAQSGFFTYFVSQTSMDRCEIISRVREYSILQGRL
jgi:hypothetical protein